jgi:hypothetical protein
MEFPSNDNANNNNDIFEKVSNAFKGGTDYDSDEFESYFNAFSMIKKKEEEINNETEMSTMVDIVKKWKKDLWDINVIEDQTYCDSLTCNFEMISSIYLIYGCPRHGVIHYCSRERQCEYVILNKDSTMSCPVSGIDIGSMVHPKEEYNPNVGRNNKVRRGNYNGMYSDLSVVANRKINTILNDETNVPEFRKRSRDDSGYEDQEYEDGDDVYSDDNEEFDSLIKSEYEPIDSPKTAFERKNTYRKSANHEPKKAKKNFSREGESSSTLKRAPSVKYDLQNIRKEANCVIYQLLYNTQHRSEIENFNKEQSYKFAVQEIIKLYKEAKKKGNAVTIQQVDQCYMSKMNRKKRLMPLEYNQNLHNYYVFICIKLWKYIIGSPHYVRSANPSSRDSTRKRYVQLMRKIAVSVLYMSRSGYALTLNGTIEELGLYDLDTDEEAKKSRVEVKCIILKEDGYLMDNLYDENDLKLVHWSNSTSKVALKNKKKIGKSTYTQGENLIRECLNSLDTKTKIELSRELEELYVIHNVEIEHNNYIQNLLLATVQEFRNKLRVI